MDSNFSMDTNIINHPLRSSLFEIDISNTLGSDYVEMCNDITRFIMIQVGIQIMLSTTDPERFPFFTNEFFILLMFIIIGVMIYWLVLRKIITFK